MKRWLLFLSLCLAIGAGCSATPPAATMPPLELTPTHWYLLTSIPPSTPTPNPADTPQPAPTSISARDELERALVSRVHWETNAICEWEVLGQTPQDLYVWVVCQSIANDSAVSVPAAVHLGTDGRVARVDVPRDGSLYAQDVRALFPQDLHQRIFAHDVDANAMWARVAARRAGLPPVTVTPTPQPGPGTNTMIDCAAVYPGLPGCLRQEALVGGRLAFVDERSPFNGRPVVIDLQSGASWTLGDRGAWLAGWSPSGTYLLTYIGEERYTVCYYNGAPTTVYGLPFLVEPVWSPREALSDSQEWLAAPSADGSLKAISFPFHEMRQVLTSGSLSKDGRDIVRWSPDGWLAWSLNLDQLAESGQWVQTLYIQPADQSKAPVALRVSEDFRKTYYLLMDWAPGTHLILAAKGMAANSLWSWGVPLSTINADTGKITDLKAAMLLTSEAYAWHPTRPGLLALAEGGSRYLNDPRRLALLDVSTGNLTYLTGSDQSAFEPAWSPDGKLLAYAAVHASPNASGDGATLERLLNGRAIYIADPQSGKTRQLTQPPDAAVDGWPQWSADGQQLLYTRQHDNVADVRVVTLDGSHDELLVTGLARPRCNYGGCGWSRLLAYYPNH
jgi:hypothetical protein